MSWWIRVAWRRMSHDDRVEVVEAQLRNRALMLHKNGGPRPGLSIFPGIVPTDEEFSARAGEIVDYTGSDQRAALNLIHLGDELAEKMDRKVSEIDQAFEDENPDDDLPALPPPNGER
jgi:hypothetical protein